MVLSLATAAVVARGAVVVVNLQRQVAVQPLDKVTAVALVLPQAVQPLAQQAAAVVVAIAVQVVAALAAVKAVTVVLPRSPVHL